MITDPSRDVGIQDRPKVTPIALLAGGFLAAFLLVVYLPSFRAPFIFDDTQNILENATLRSLWPIWHTLRPPLESGLVGRPLVNLSLALNYAWSGTDPWSYHVANFAIHLGATLLLWGLLHALIAGQNAVSSLPLTWRWSLPWICALLWGLHPLHTQAVTYVIQRCESLMGFFYFAALLAFVRSWNAKRTLLWQGLGLLAFLACLACKEVAVTMLPVVLALSWVARGDKPGQAIRKAPLFFFGMLLALAGLALAMVLGSGYSTHPDHLLPPGLSYIFAQGPILLRY